MPISAFSQTTHSDTNSVPVEVMPTYIGGDDAMHKFLGDNLTYPEMAKYQGIQGKVWIGFTIDTLGLVNDVVILRGIGGGCDEEAKRVVDLMPPWKPGTMDGKKVIVKYRLPIYFKLEDKKKKKEKKQ